MSKTNSLHEHAFSDQQDQTVTDMADADFTALFQCNKEYLH
jgi:hypothetical protein